MVKTSRKLAVKVLVKNKNKKLTRKQLYKLKDSSGPLPNNQLPGFPNSDDLKELPTRMVPPERDELLVGAQLPSVVKLPPPGVTTFFGE
jgi:hypothetical protein